MRNYKIQITHEQMQYLHATLDAMFNSKFILDKVDHMAYYNVKSFIKTLHTKLYQLSDHVINKKRNYTVSIDVNEYKAFKELYSLCQEGIDNNDYLRVLYMQVIQQCDKQEINILERHKYLNPPTALIRRKNDIDNSFFIN